jgi:hypothetical protein
LYALWLNCALLVNGRVSNFKVTSELRFRDSNRSILTLGENVGGTKNLDGTITGGTSYDVDTVSIRHTITEGGCISGALFGMPEHRGYVKNLIFEDNEIHCNLTGIEPNNLCQNYSIQRNKIYTPATPIDAWRYSKDGVIKDNLFYGTTVKDVPRHAPAGWKNPENVYVGNNLNITQAILKKYMYGDLPVFDANLSINQNIQTGVATQFNLNGISNGDYDTDIFNIDLDNNAIIVKVTGTYKVSLMCSWNANVTGDRGVLTKVDDSAYHFREYKRACNDAGNVTTTNLDDTLHLIAGQKIKFYGFQTCGLTMISLAALTLHIVCISQDVN